jgi:Zinc finger, C2H2 type
MSHISNYQLSSPRSDSDEDNEFYETVSDGKVIIYTCKAPSCKKAFRFKSEIQRHLTTHSALRPHPCKYPNCNKSFKRKDALQNHMRTHTNEKPYVCTSSKCNMRFATRAGLRYHLLKHQGEKVFKCSNPECDREFWTLAQLLKHEASNIHSKDSSESCSDESLQTLEEHMYPSQFEITPLIAPKALVNSEALTGLMKIFRENELLRMKLEENERLINMLQNRSQNLSYIKPVEVMDNTGIFNAGINEVPEEYYTYHFE